MTNRHPTTPPRPSEPFTPIPSPLETLLPYLTDEEIDELPYPPDLLPGARDVPTPHGSIRVNEWGPENGRRVLFIHGDATPSPLWAKIANSLAHKGCRVMTFDLFGRGYTASPYPLDYTPALLKQQVLYVISSSAVSWTGPGSAEHGRPAGFAIVGFSLGGGIAVDFASHFPHLVNALVLLAPVGLLRRLPDDYDLIYSAQTPLDGADPEMKRLVARILEVRTDVDPRHARKIAGKKLVERRIRDAEVSDWKTWEPRSFGADADAEAAFLAGLLQFQFDYNVGHFRSLYSTARHGPIRFMHESWRRTGDHVSGKTGAVFAGVPNLLDGKKLLFIMGEADNIVPREEVEEDVLELMPPEKVEFMSVPGNHGFVYPNSDVISQKIIEWLDI